MNKGSETAIVDDSQHLDELVLSVGMVEDSAQTRSLTENQLDKLLNEKKTGTGLWPPDWSCFTSFSFRTNQLQIDDLSRIVELGTTDDIGLRGLVLRSLTRMQNPHCLILDLAITKEETDLLLSKGGGDPTGAKDPTEWIPMLTGFRILNAIVGNPRIEDPPVIIVSTHMASPQIHKACLDAGAFSVVWKPLPDGFIRTYWDTIYDEETFRPYLGDMYDAKRAEAEAHIPAINYYFSSLAREVLKGIKAVAMHRSYPCAPGAVPFWALNDDLIEGRRIDDTSLVLMDVRGFSRMVHHGRQKPSAVFSLMNCIWTDVLDILKHNGFEVNNFVGDAVLAFRGVYPVSDRGELQVTMSCAKQLCNAFSEDGLVRKNLIERVKEVFKGSALQEQRETLLAHISDVSAFGLRVVAVAPDDQESLFGRVGGKSRWQHTILSRFMNALARVESLVGKWEKSNALKTTSSAHFFLLWDGARDEPEFDGVELLRRDRFLASEYLSKMELNPELSESEGRDIPNGFVILKARWTDDGAPVD